MTLEENMVIELTREEATCLRATLEQSLMALREELHHTEDRGFKAELRGEEDILQAVLAKVRAAAE